MLVSKNPREPNTNPWRPNANPYGSKVTPNTSQWNIGGVGSSGVGARVGLVNFMMFVSISFAVGTQRKRVFSGIWALTYRYICTDRH